MKVYLKKISLVFLALAVSSLWVGCSSDDGPPPLSDGEKLAVTWRAQSVSKQLEGAPVEAVDFSTYRITFAVDAERAPSTYNQSGIPTGESAPDYKTKSASGTWAFSQGTTQIVFNPGGNESRANLQANLSANNVPTSITISWVDSDISPKGDVSYTMVLEPTP